MVFLVSVAGLASLKTHSLQKNAQTDTPYVHDNFYRWGESNQARLWIVVEGLRKSPSQELEL